MDQLNGTSPLNFREDYFATRLSDNDEEFQEDENDEINELVNDNSHNGRANSQQNNLRKMPSIVSLSLNANDGPRTGIMFNDLRTAPTSGLNLENVSIYEEPRADTNNTISYNDDTMSTILSPMARSILGDNVTANGVSDDIEDENDSEFLVNENRPFPFHIAEEPEPEMELEHADECPHPADLFSRRQHFFILSTAGKPIYSMHGSYDLLVVYSGVIQTIVSFFKYSSNGEETLKMIDSMDVFTKKPIKFVFLDKSPLILMTISKVQGATQVELEQQLDFIYSFIISALSKSYIDKVFNKYANFDLRNLLGQTDLLTLDSICQDLANNLNSSQILGGLQTLRMHSRVRSRLDRKLNQLKSPNLLYGLILGPDEKLITIIRPRKHNLHTSDLMVLFEMIYNTNTFKTKVEQSLKENDMELLTNETFWVPICLPKFNSNGHLYTLLQFSQLNDDRYFQLHDINNDTNTHRLKQFADEPDKTKIAIILMSPYKDAFAEMRKVSSNIMKEILFDKRIYTDIWNSMVGNGRIFIERVLSPPKVSQTSWTQNRSSFSMIMSTLTLGGKTTIPAPTPVKSEPVNNSILHFTVKNKRLVQSVFPESKYFDIHDAHTKSSLLTLYRYLRRKLQLATTNPIQLQNLPSRPKSIPGADSDTGESHPSTVYEIWTNNATGVDMVGFAARFGNYEVLLVGSGNHVDEKTMKRHALHILKWSRRNEQRLFIS